MRLVACAAGVLGGACWLASAFVEGDPAILLFWIGLALLSITWLGVGFLTASGSLFWLRAIVALGFFALVWSVVGFAISELPDEPVLGAVGGVVLVVALVAFMTGAGASHHHGSHAR